jgi:F0F1-type ATP synthase assembly protein I
MHLKRTLIVVFALAAAICFVAWVGARAERVSAAWVWSWGIGMVIFSAAMVWAFQLKEAAPDFLAQLGLNYFERNGFCFALIPEEFNGLFLVNILYQNRYEGRCDSEILIKISGTGGWNGTAASRLRISCKGAAFGRESIPWDISREAAGQKVTCFVGADVVYPEGYGQLVRSRDGIQIGSIEEASTSELLHLISSPARLEFVIPSGISGTTNSASSASDSQIAAAGRPPSSAPRTLVKSQVTRSGTRVMQVRCEGCGHSYEYIMRREAAASCEAGDEQAARQNAEAEAQARLRALLAEGCDVVPCPQCGLITARMRAEKREIRGAVASAIIAGAVLVIVGAGIGWLVYRIGATTSFLFYGVGIFGLVIAGVGVAGLLRGLAQLATGKPDPELSSDLENKG